MRHVEKVVSWGPHPPGSEAQEKVGDYILQELESYGLEVGEQRFEALTPIGRVQMRNIFADLPGREDAMILLASHYDSKYFEDKSFVGANDGGSSTAVVLELARLLSQGEIPPTSFRFVFFDGEESFRHWTSLDSLYGSREFVKKMRRAGELRNVRALILLDLIGGRDLKIERDVNSDERLNDLFWETARELGYEDLFSPLGRTNAVDDHIPFAEVGVPVIDLIDLEYAHWHLESDTVDKLSPSNMARVGHVVLEALPKIPERNP